MPLGTPPGMAAASNMLAIPGEAASHAYVSKVSGGKNGGERLFCSKTTVHIGEYCERVDTRYGVEINFSSIFLLEGRQVLSFLTALLAPHFGNVRCSPSHE